MTYLPTSIALAALTFFVAGPGQDDPSTSPVRTGQQKAGAPQARAGGSGIGAPTDPAHRPWTLTWDDSLDGKLDRTDKSCQIALDAIDNAVTGRFLGPVMGTKRRAVFTGELIQGGALLLLQQREPGYVCSYQFSSSGAGWTGTWRDSQGRSGTSKLARKPVYVDV